MAYVSIADRDHEVEHHDPDTFISKYVWSQDHKVIAIQYGVIAILIGLVGMLLSSAFRLQLGFPDTFEFINPENYYQFVTIHGMIMVIYLLTALFLGGFGNYLIPLQLGSRDMVFPFMNMLSVWVYALSVLILVASFFVPGGATGAGWTLVSATSDIAGNTRHRLGHRADAAVAGRVHRRIHDGRSELRHDGTSGSLQGHDADAYAVVRLGYLHGDHSWSAGVSRIAGQRHHDAVR